MSEYMKAAYVCGVIVTILFSALIFLHVRGFRAIREGLSNGPSPLQLAKTNKNNVKYLQERFKKIKNLPRNVVDVSGQHHQNKEALDHAMDRINKARDKAVGGLATKLHKSKK